MIYEPRDYQYEDIAKIRDTYKAGSKATIYVSHTGSGKTIVFSYITERLYQNKQKILICTHRDNILQETSKKLTAIGLKHGIIAPGYPSVRYQIQLASIQTLVRRLNQWNFDWFDWMIFDECHHIGASTWQKIRSHFYKANLYGTTATPVRLDGYGMGNDFETMIVGKSYDYLVDKGFLSYPVYYVPENLQLDYDLAHIKKNGYDYNKKQSELILDKRIITGNAIAEYAKLCDKEPALAFCVSIKHAEHVAEEFRNAGYLTDVIHSKIKPAKIAETIEKLRRGELHVVTSCDKVGEGTDIPKLRAVILLRYTASITVNHQQNGRASRPYEGKENSIHIDLVGNCKTHGLINFPIKWELTKGKFEPPVQGVIECEFCMKYYSVNLRACPHCGKMRIIKKKKRQDPIVVPGELKRVDYIKLNEDVKKAESLYDLKKIAKEVGYKPGWAYHRWKYKQRVKEEV
jgi:DNA repair protein RadD